MTSIHILHSLLAQPAAPSLSGAGFKCRRGNWGAWLLPSRTGKPALGQATAQSIWVSYLTALNQLCQTTGHRTQVAQDSSPGVRRWVQERGAAFPPKWRAGATDHGAEKPSFPSAWRGESGERKSSGDVLLSRLSELPPAAFQKGD